MAVATRTEPRAAMLQQSSWPHTPLLPSALRVPNFDAKSRHCMTLQNVPPNRIPPVLANRSGGQRPSQRTARRPASLSPAEKEGTKIRGIKSLNQCMGKKSNYILILSFVQKSSHSKLQFQYVQNFPLALFPKLLIILPDVEG